ncbi:RDD family protein [Streptomyces sp. NPDC004376]
MSAPTPAHGDDRPREGYYPDPSIPGYVRYWNGTAWMPGTSRPAPADGEPLTPPGGRAASPAVVEETGPHFFDEEPPTGSPAWDTDAPVADTFLSRRPTPGPGAPPVQGASGFGAGVPFAQGGVQGADGSGFGAAPQGPVGGGVPGARGPGGSGEGVPVASGGQFAAQGGASGGAPGAGGAEGGNWAPGGTSGGANGPAGPEAPGVAAGGFGGVGAPGVQGQGGVDSRPGGQVPAGAGDAHGAQGPTGVGGPAAGAGGFGPAHSGNRPGVAGGRPEGAAALGFNVVTPPGAPGGFGSVVPGARSAQAGGPAAPDLGGQNAGGGQASWAQQVHRLAGGGEEQTVAPWKPVVEDPFLAAVRRQAAGRPAGLGKRLVARLIDSLFVGAVTAAAAVPLGVRTVDHLRHKVEAARLSGRTVTVWLIDGTTGTYLAVVLAVLLLFGVAYEVLPTAKWGRTLGKRLVGLQVRDIEAHEPPTFGAALRRWLVYCVPGLLGIGAVGVLWGLFDRPWRQCWHDKAAHTFVAD